MYLMLPLFRSPETASDPSTTPIPTPNRPQRQQQQHGSSSSANPASTQQQAVSSPGRGGHPPAASSGGGSHHQQNVTLSVSAEDPASDGGLLPLEPPLSSSDYSFTLDDGENLNDLFDLFREERQPPRSRG